MPAVQQLNASGPDIDYLVMYNPDSGVIQRLEPSLSGLSVHGMDVVASSSNPAELFIYAVNHRKPIGPKSALTAGANSTIEIFKTVVGSGQILHVQTVHDPVIISPNDVVGSPDGSSFFFTNDHASKLGVVLLAGVMSHLVVASGIHGANGIIGSPGNSTFFVASTFTGGVTVFERQNDNAFLKTHHIPIDRPIDNLSMDENGAVWAAAPAMLRHIANPSSLSPSSAHVIAMNTGPGSFYGEKYTVTKIFEDDGLLAPGTTTVAFDTRRNRLFLHGIAAPHLTVCAI
ncbi:unnamed protein product [Mycena citricolor]|uniref:SMP-30/Gluconolactonase/LRE-like region domain-containing protein n=1 Tax=Mycena citricolor TaxID=2018698 RepID=A0AAD2K6B7_9AGAR|nr:unnamed protein product [Mycena citricolor]